MPQAGCIGRAGQRYHQHRDAAVSPIAADDVLQTVGLTDDLLGRQLVSCIVPQALIVPAGETGRNFARAELATTGSGKGKAAGLHEIAATRTAELAGLV